MGVLGARGATVVVRDRDAGDVRPPRAERAQVAVGQPEGFLAAQEGQDSTFDQREVLDLMRALACKPRDGRAVSGVELPVGHGGACLVEHFLNEQAQPQVDEHLGRAGWSPRRLGGLVVHRRGVEVGFPLCTLPPRLRLRLRENRREAPDFPGQAGDFRGDPGNFGELRGALRPSLVLPSVGCPLLDLDEAESFDVVSGDESDAVKVSEGLLGVLLGLAEQRPDAGAQCLGVVLSSSPGIDLGEQEQVEDSGGVARTRLELLGRGDRGVEGGPCSGHG